MIDPPVARALAACAESTRRHAASRTHPRAREREREPLPTDNSRGSGSVNKRTSLTFFSPWISRDDFSRTIGKTRGCGRAGVRACDWGCASDQLTAARDHPVRVIAHRTNVLSRWYHRRRQRMYGERQPGLADYAIRLPPTRAPRREEVCLACHHTSMVQVSE